MTTTDTDIQKPRIQMGWLDNARFDSLLILGVFAMAVISGVIVSYRPELFIPIMLIDLWILGYHHVISTFTKLAGTKEDRKDNWKLIYPLPVLVLMGVAFLATVFGIWTVVTVYLFWQWFHYTRQSWGIAAFYKRKAGATPPKNIYFDQAIFWAVPFWGILNRCAQGWDEFLFLPVWMPEIPVVIADVVGILAVAALGIWAYQRYKQYTEGTLSFAQTAFEASHFTIFYIGYIALSELNHGWLAVNIWHNAQYILFVWLYNTNRFKHIEQHGRSLMAWISQKTPPRTILYFMFCLLLTTLFYKNMQLVLSHISNGEIMLLMTLNVIIFQTVNFHHYIVDSIIWKARNKKNQAVMKIK
ncbi:MAG: hypothetical protein JKY71_08150 [Alphaproteobacteria bacterium]|nr:hypothetical protein [Alphaproteobacteria bacterium]